MPGVAVSCVICGQSLQRSEKYPATAFGGRQLLNLERQAARAKLTAIIQPLDPFVSETRGHGDRLGLFWKTSDATTAVSWCYTPPVLRSAVLAAHTERERVGAALPQHTQQELLPHNWTDRTGCLPNLQAVNNH